MSKISLTLIVAALMTTTSTPTIAKEASRMPLGQAQAICEAEGVSSNQTTLGHHPGLVGYWILRGIEHDRTRAITRGCLARYGYY